MNEPKDVHRRPPGTTDATVAALGVLSESFEMAEAARGHLIQFHRLIGAGDARLRVAVELLRQAEHQELADVLDHHLVGRDVLEGRWTFQIVEEYDDNYHDLFRALEKQAREELVGGRRHLLEAELKVASQRRCSESRRAATNGSASR